MMPFIRIASVEGRVSFANVADIQTIAPADEDPVAGPSFILTFRNGRTIACRGEAEEVRRKIAGAEK